MPDLNVAFLDNGFSLETFISFWFHTNVRFLLINDKNVANKGKRKPSVKMEGSINYSTN
jgi:hypothetical protein